MQFQFKNSLFLFIPLVLTTPHDFLHAAQKQKHTQKVHVGGAGVLPYALNPKNNKLYVLLGREKRGKSAGKWGDFGGKAEKRDHNDPLATAAREYTEETEKIFGGFQHNYDALSKHGIILRWSDRKSGLYVRYALKVPYTHNINANFPAKHEKNQLWWVSMERFTHRLEQGNPDVGKKHHMLLRGDAFRVYSRPEVLKKLKALH